MKLRCPAVLFSVLLLTLQHSSLIHAIRLPNPVTDDGHLYQSQRYKDDTVYGSVVFSTSSETSSSSSSSSSSYASFEFIPQFQVPGAIAWGSFIDGAVTVSNFGQLRVTTSGAHSDRHQTFAAGFLEGYLTAPRIYQNFQNLHNYFVKTMNASLEEPMAWIHKQDTWVRQQCGKGGGKSLKKTGRELHDASSRFWNATCLAISQFDGLVAGYQARQQKKTDSILLDNGIVYSAVGAMEYEDFLFMESNGDLYDIIDKLDPTQRPSWSPGGPDPDDEDDDVGEHKGQYIKKRRNRNRNNNKTNNDTLFHNIALGGKCSALISVAPDLSDIFIGHATWDSYTAMLRIYKHYSFNLTELQPAAQRISFSSYPGEIFSDDDFFILSSKLVVVQTTNKIFNDALFDVLTPHSVLSWQRIRAANWLSTDGQEWTDVLGMENSGTYNNQYMVIDLNRFSPGEELKPGLLWVAEQIPGQVVARDMTATLALGYWPSFNVPAFPEIYNASGYPDFIKKIEKFGQHFSKSTHWLSYETSPRAAIFRRDHTSVVDIDSMKALMRSNNWKNDPLSEGHPICAVCGRGDLDASYPEARGCYDTKVTSWRMALDMEAEAVNGPTTGTDMTPHSSAWPSVHPKSTKLPEFHWDRTEKVVGEELLHLGMPESFNFKFERQSP